MGEAHRYVEMCGLWYPVRVQLGLHSGDIAPYRRFLLQLLALHPQPVEELLEGHVQPLPGRHLRVQVSPGHSLKR